LFYPILSKWSVSYNALTGAKVNYQSIGSGGGIAQIKAGTVTFGASDKPLSSQELASNPKGPLAQFPVVIGGVVPVVNLPGVQPGELRLTGPVIADIYLGKILKWTDPAIVSLNPGVSLPDALITVVHRSDGSGTNLQLGELSFQRSATNGRRKSARALGPVAHGQWRQGKRRCRRLHQPDQGFHRLCRNSPM